MAKQQQRPPQQQQQQQQRQQPAQQQQPRKAAAAPVRNKAPKETLFSTGSKDMIFDRTSFMYMGAGLALILIGLALMAGGAMPDPMKWEPERIYSFRRITLAPFVMVVGFLVVAAGIFKKTGAASSVATDNVVEA
jgi:uncharacterized membrane protein